MGTTESIFSDENPPSTDLYPSSSPQEEEQQQISSPRARRRRSDASPPHQKQQQQQQRRRPSKQKPIKRINGLVLGGPSTGKRTLLQRLQGNDPYANSNAKEKDAAADDDHAPSNLTVNIPYMSPPDTPVWDRILLNVRASSDVPEKVDFVAILVSPQHDLPNTEIYIINVLTSYLKLLGYQYQQPQQQQNSKDGGDGDKQNMTISQEPVCICILFNFRDLQKSPPPRDELESLIEELLQSYGCFSRQKVFLQFTDTCLRNCYGLNVLHSFIFRTYLLKRQAALEVQLQAVSAQINVTKDQSDDAKSYKDFLKMLGPSSTSAINTKAPTSQKKKKKRPDNGRGSEATQKSPDSKHSLEQESHLAPQSNTPIDPTPTQPSNGGINNINQRGPRRQFMSTKQPVRVGKEALEAFLASDSEEDETLAVALAKRKAAARMLDSSDDDDDDDFFYDERGNRRFNHPTNQNRSTTTSSSDDDSEGEHQEESSRTIMKTFANQITKPENASRDAEQKKKVVAAKSTRQQEESRIPAKQEIDMSTGSAQLGRATTPTEPNKDARNHDPNVKGKAATPRSVGSLSQVRGNGSDDSGVAVDKEAAEEGDETLKPPPGSASTAHSNPDQHEHLKEIVPTHKADKLDVSESSAVAERDNIETSPSVTEARVDEKSSENKKSGPDPPKDDDGWSDDDQFFVESTGQQDSENADDKEPTSEEKSCLKTSKLAVTHAAVDHEDGDDDDEYMLQTTLSVNLDHPEDTETMEAREEEQDFSLLKDPPALTQESNEETKTRHSPIPAVSQDVQEESDDEEFFVGSGSGVPKSMTTSTTQALQDDSDDDEEFIVKAEAPPKADDEEEVFVDEETVTQAGSIEISRSLAPQHGTPPAEAPTTGISAAALAAIAAAQVEAEAMLLQPQESFHGAEKPKKSKKKKSDKKKKKKDKKKESGSD